MLTEDVSPSLSNCTITLPKELQSISGSALCIVASNDGTKVYLGGHSGVWVSDDGGKTFYHSEQLPLTFPFGQAQSALLSPNVYDLLISPRDKNIVLAATGRDARSPRKHGIYRSIDGAKSWNLVHQFTWNGTVGEVGRLVVAPDDPLLIFAAGEFAIGISNDGGYTWIEKRPQQNISDKVWYVAVGPNTGSLRRVYAVGHQVWYSEDGGNTWRQDSATPSSLPMGPPSDAAGFGSLTVAIHPSDSCVIYIIKKFSDGHAELWRGDFSQFNNNSSAIWKLLPSIPINYPHVTPSGNTFIIPHISKFNGILYLIASDCRTTHISFGEPQSSTDWVRIDNNIHIDPHGMALTPDFEHFYLSPGNLGKALIISDGGLYYTEDGARTWIQGEGLSNLTILNTAILPVPDTQPALCIGTTDNSGFFSTDGGETWKTQNYDGGDNDWCFSDPLQSSRLIVFAPRWNSIVLYASDDGSVADGSLIGQSIPEAPKLPAPSDPSGPGTIVAWNARSTYANMGYRPLILTIHNESAHEDGDFIVIFSSGLRTILLRTQSMSRISNSQDWLPNSGTNDIVFQEGPDLPDLFVNIVQASGGHDNPVYYVGDLSTIFSDRIFLSGPKGERLWKWRKGMSHWKQIVPVLPGSNGPRKAKRFFVNPYRDNILYVLDADHIYRSEDGGAAWTIDVLMEQALTENGAFPFVIGSDTNPEDALIRDMIFDPHDPYLRFAAGPAGVFYTCNGIEWNSIILTAANPMHITSLAYDFVSNIKSRSLYVSTSNRGLLRLKPQKKLLNTQGKVVFLRVHDVGTGWGPPHDFIDVECVIKLASDITRSYGFQLRSDSNLKAHEDMLNLLRDAFNHDWTVSIDYEIEEFKKNGIIIRVMSI